MLETFGIAAGVLAGIAVIPYIRDILGGTTKPERASWLIWSVLSSIAFFSQLAEGASWSLWLTGIDTLGVIITFLLALKYGVGGFTRRDIAALCVAAIGLIVWYFSKHAFLALFIVIAIDLIGTLLTIIKTYQSPKSETMSTWLLIGVAGICSMISVGSFDPILLTYPFYIALANFAVVFAILFGKRKRVH